jgi:hypothetical protein
MAFHCGQIGVLPTMKPNSKEDWILTTLEYVQTILQVKKDAPPSQNKNEDAIFEAAGLVSGSFIYPLYQELWKNFFNMDDVTEHLESLYDSEDYFGLVYFVFMLANSVEFTIPVEFTEMSARDTLVPILAAAIIEDWLEYDNSFVATEIIA